ncbi:uncharacterized protein DS421_14g467770 [Arachis hypogaea]|nr:uncharacterized protein DS421_14g467770 [Arachis hypogaea]
MKHGFSHGAGVSVWDANPMPTRGGYFKRAYRRCVFLRYRILVELSQIRTSPTLFRCS